MLSLLIVLRISWIPHGMPKVFMKYSVDVGRVGFLKHVASAVDVLPVDVSVLVELVAHVIHVESPLLVELVADVIHVASPMLVLLPFGDVLFVILIILMRLEVLQLRQIPFSFLLAAYLPPLLHVAMFVLELILVENFQDPPCSAILQKLF